MKHYYNPMSRAVTTHWMLLEAGAAHEQIMVDLSGGDTTTPAFRAINPMGKIPTLVDGDMVISETAAICAYIADKYPEKGLAPQPGSRERGAYYRYMFVPGQTLEPMFTFNMIGAKNYSPHSVGFGDMGRCMDTIDAMTPESGWALGDRFTAADVVFGGTLDFAIRFGWLTAPSDKVTAYVERLQARPAYRQSHSPSME